MTDQPQQHAASQPRRTKAAAFSRPSSSRTTSITHAITIKDEEPFFLAEPDGAVPGPARSGYGFYFRDCLFLDRLEIRLNGQTPTTLMASAGEGFAARYELSNPPLPTEKTSTIAERSLGVRLDRTIQEGPGPNEATLHQRMTIANFSIETVDLIVTVSFGSRFLDVFEVRGMETRSSRPARRTIVNADSVLLAERGVDGAWRSIALTFEPQPESLHPDQARYHLSLRPGEQQTLACAILASVGPTLNPSIRPPAADAEIRALHQKRRESRAEWLGRQTQVTSSSALFNAMLERALLDLRMLRTELDGDEYFAAGLPWFGTLFGRDSVITALQTLAIDFTLAEKTLRVLARFQGARVDPRRSEEPGKILHELRVGPLARAHRIPSPYYGSVDSTPLFLNLLAEHYAWSGNAQLFRDLRPNVEAALRWIDDYGTQNGFLVYGTGAGKGYLVNQGWKDSGDAIMNADGSLAVPPIALVEVQGYVYRAKRALAELFEAQGEPATARQLRQDADALQARFEEHFWLPEHSMYALALQNDLRPCAVSSSNPGQALWGGIVSARRAPAVSDRLMDDRMFSGWGVRTLAASEVRYNPIGYHLGTVWPHDNSIIAAGLRSYGLDQPARRVLAGVVDAATHLPHYRLPELFAGFARSAFADPAHYPVACHPQAWASGAIPFLLQTALGLRPNAAAGILRIVRPDLPPGIEWLEVTSLRVGDASIHLRFARDGARTAVSVMKSTGKLEVSVDDAP